jgi:hypothetical protein
MKRSIVEAPARSFHNWFHELSVASLCHPRIRSYRQKLRYRASSLKSPAHARRK